MGYVAAAVAGAYFHAVVKSGPYRLFARFLRFTRVPPRIAVEAQVNVTVSSEDSFRFGNPGGTNINTPTGIFAAFYF